MKLRTRFALFSIFLIAIVVAGVSYGTLYFLKALVLREIETSQKTLVANLKKVCEESQLSRDDIFAYNYITSLQKTSKGVAYAVFVDIQRGLILGKNDAFMEVTGSVEKALLSAKDPKPQELVRLKNGREILSYAAGVVIPSQGSLGAVYLGFFQKVVEENIAQSIRQITTIILYVAAGAFVIGLLFSLLFAIGLTRPIRKLAEGAQAIGEGNLDTQIDIRRKDEIGLLAQEFNTMAVKLKELDTLKDAFVSSVSHELRSPLTAISGYVELLTMKPFHELNPEKAMKALNIIQESTMRLTRFVNDILDVAKIKAGKMTLHKTHFDVPATLESVVGLFQPLFEKKRIVSAIHVAPEVPVIAADVEKVRQVITNLLSNAYKFTPEGGSITVSSNVQGDAVVIYVQDSGIGIPKQYQGMIFGKFQQVPGQKEKIANIKGTGLGLAIAKGIVEAHGGTIAFVSEEGQGTTFYFSLPVKAETGSTTVESKHLA